MQQDFNKNARRPNSVSSIIHHLILSKYQLKTVVKATALSSAFILPTSYASDLVLSGVFDGPLSGGVPKVIEVYVKNDIADLSVCGIGSANNGGGSDGQEFTFSSVSASAGDYIHIASESPMFTEFFGFSPAYTSGVAAINGDDAIELFCDGSVVDVFGDINVDGNGEPWEYLDGWAKRIADTGPDGSVFSLASWTFSGPNAMDGETSNDTAAVPFPIGTSSGGGTPPDPTPPADGPCFNCDPLDKIKDASTFIDADYYAEALLAQTNGETASEIKAKVTTAISTGHKVLTYKEVWTALTETDEDPANPDNVTLLYSGISKSKMSNGSGAQSSDPDNWNREHVWPKSHGFSDEVYEGYTDIHHLRPTDISVNSSRGNLDFDNSDSPLTEAPSNRVDGDSFEPRDSVKGDVARMVFYMDTRYEGLDTTPDLQVVDRLTSTGEPALGLLCRLMEWHLGDPVDATEQLRNDTIYEYQGNRNPFIDHPEWAELFYSATSCGSTEPPVDPPVDPPVEPPVDPAPSGSLIISEYVEGTGYNKAIELFNPTSSDIDLSSENYVLGRYSNGGVSPTNISLTGVIQSQSTHVIVTSDNRAASELIALADQRSGSISHNGDDAYVLFKDGTAVDSFGRVGEDPGSNWGDGSFSTKDNTLVRNANVTSGDVVIDDEFDPSTEWTGNGTNDFSGLGSHTIENPELYISEYIEGGGSNKALEIYNPGSSDVDLTALNYELGLYVNGSDTPNVFSLSGVVPAKGVFVVANPSAVSDITDVADQLTSGINHNGDDAYELYKDGVVIDSIGQAGTDPGSRWGSGSVTTKDNTLVRKASVKVGDTDSSDAFDPAVEWDGYPKDTFTYLGSHNGSSDGGGGGGGSTAIGECSSDATFVHAIQGEGFESPLLGETHVIEGVVTGSFAGLDGFFVQEEDSDADANMNTSEGIFVSSSETPAVGSLVRVIGSIEESFGKTQLKSAESLLDCGTGTVTATSLSLPFSSAEDREAIEGMLVTSSADLIVSDNYNLGRFGEVVLSSKLLSQPTNVFTPLSPEAIALADENQLNRIILDDGLNGSNPEVVVYPTGGLSASNTLRLGDTVSAVEGVVDYSYGSYRIVPTTEPSFVHTNPRTESPVLTEGNLKVASLNVLNLFNGDGMGGEFPTPRGATNIEEFERQIAKTVAAIVAIDADIVGLMEIENDGVDENSVIAELVERLNVEMGAGTYAFVDAGGPIGTDAIAVGLLYKPSSVNLEGAAKLNLSSVFHRPPLAQTFSLAANGERVTVVVNHFKSKGSCGSATGLDQDQSDGQGCYNATRVTQANELTNWIATETDLSAETDVLIIGDLNAYAKEDPITAILGSGYTNLVSKFGGEYAYSYLFSGQVGYLDHAIASNSLADKAVDALEWHINSVEPRVLDYNLEYKSTQQQSDFYSPDVYRMSDHDPVVVTFDLGTDAIAGDWDGDGDIDIVDVRAFISALRNKEEIDISYDFNSDGVVSYRDVFYLSRSCTNPRCK